MGLSCQKDLFDIPPGLAHLNCAYMGPLSRPVLAAGHAGLDRKKHPWGITRVDFFAPVDEARALFAEVIGADAEGVALTPSVSYGIATAALNVGPSSGRRIVLLASEFPSNVYAWRWVAGRAGAEIVTVGRPEDHDWTRALLEAIDERTDVVSVPNCHWTDGGLVDLVRVGERARDAGAALVVDGIQSIGAMPMDVARVRPDFLVTAGYKWLLGPYSTGFLWAAPHRREGTPLEHNWMPRERSDDFARLVDYADELRRGARRYDVGEVSNFALVPAVVAALRQTLSWGIANVSTYIERLTDRIADTASDLGLRVAPRALRAPHLIGVQLGEGANAIASAMASARVYVSVRGDAMRVSPHVYNDDEDVDRLLDVLSAAYSG